LPDSLQELGEEGRIKKLARKYICCADIFYKAGTNNLSRRKWWRLFSSKTDNLFQLLAAPLRGGM
jgi:hypothetical protein